MDKKTANRIQSFLHEYKSTTAAGAGKIPEQKKYRDKLFREAQSAMESLENLFSAETLDPPASLDMSAEDAQAVHFCGGAILLQQGKSPLEDVLYPSTGLSTHPSLSRPGLRRCKDCNLWVDALPAFNIPSLPDLVAASHLVMCESFSSRHAFYRCTFCCKDLITFDFKTSDDLQMHFLFAHPEEIVSKQPEDLEKTLDRADSVLKDTPDEPSDPDIRDAVPMSPIHLQNDFRGLDPVPIAGGPPRQRPPPIPQHASSPFPDGQAERYASQQSWDAGRNDARTPEPTPRRHLPPPHPPPPRPPNNEGFGQWGYPNG